MPRKKKAEPATPAKTADYQPTPAEAEQFEAFLDRRAGKPPAPQVKLTHEPGQRAQISPDHPVLGMWGAAFQTAFGTTEPNFAELMLNQLMNATHQDRDAPVSEATVNAALAAVHGIGPKDETEGMLATQMIATHHLAMKFMRRASLLPSQQALAERIATHLRESGGGPPAIELIDGGADQSARIAAACCEWLECALFRVAPGDLPQDPRGRDALILLWRRETLLSRCALMVVQDETAPDQGSARLAARQLTDSSFGPVFFTDRAWRPRERAFLSFPIASAPAEEGKALWRRHLGDAAPALDGLLDRITAHFRLDPDTIESASAHVLQESSPEELASALWDRCRQETRPQMQGLADPVVSEVSWEDLILPEPQLRLLQEVAQHAAHRYQVLERWPFAARSADGQGIAAMFTGASGTGKTLVAEVLARELRMDLYQVDLSRVVSKYIGETEKNLARIFDAAEGCGVILLFDEADALFGKRSEVRDSLDRYANIEVSYLLQRMEHKPRAGDPHLQHERGDGPGLPPPLPLRDLLPVPG